MQYTKTVWTALLGLVAGSGAFALATAGVLPATAGWAALLAVPFLVATLFIGVVGRGSPNDEHPNPVEISARGGPT
jgi:hypothetical protein